PRPTATDAQDSGSRTPEPGFFLTVPRPIMAIPDTTLDDSRGAAARFVFSTLLPAGVFLAGVFATGTAEAQKKGKQPAAAGPKSAPMAPPVGPGMSKAPGM